MPGRPALARPDAEPQDAALQDAAGPEEVVLHR